jgi:hypothetical protein
MEKARTSIGHVVSVVGAVVAFISLWQPWLRIDLGKIAQEPAFKAQLDALGGGPQLNAEIQRFVALLPGKIDGNGWDVLERSDIFFALASAAVVALFFAVAALGADGRGVGKIMAFVGLAGMAIVLQKLVSPGIPDAAGDFVERGRGPIVALVGWTLCAAGGIFTFKDDRQTAMQPAVVPAFVPEYQPDPSVTTTSVAPPSR